VVEYSPLRRDPLGDPSASEGRARYAGPDFLSDGWCPDGIRRYEHREREGGPILVVLIACPLYMVWGLWSGAVTDSGRPYHGWALGAFVVLAVVLAVAVALKVRRWRRNRTILRIAPPTHPASGKPSGQPQFGRRHN